MSGRLILWKNSTDQIKGACEAEGYVGLVELETISFEAEKREAGGAQTCRVKQGAINVTVGHGPWVADLQQRLFHGKTLGTVTITEVEQKVDGTKKTWKKVREITLTEAWMEGMSHAWTETAANAAFSVEYTDSTFAHGDKVSNFIRGDK